MEQIKQLIDAMHAGKSIDIETHFNEVMATKVSAAVDAKRMEIANSLFNTVEEAVVPGSVKKDKEGHITSVSTEPDAEAAKRKKAKAMLMASRVAKNKAYVATLRAHGGYVYGDKK